MLTKNLDLPRGLCNGSRGVVIDFEDNNDGLLIPVVRFVNGASLNIDLAKHTVEMLDGTKLERTQIPLKLAWAVTMHKSQGMTLDALEVSLRRMFTPGQAYVGLSRARDRKGLCVLGWDGRIVPVSPKVQAFSLAYFKGREFVLGTDT
jgi:ATP-dependent DNA helicase PIF1